MSTGTKLAAVVAVAAVAGLFLVPLDTGIAASTGLQSQNETISVDTTESIELQGYDIQNESVVVTYENGTTVPDSAYTVGHDGGYIVFDDTVGGDSVSVSYDYQATDGMTATLMQQWPLLAALVALVALGGAMEDMQ